MKTPTWPMYRALVGIGMLCGLVIAVVFLGTQPVIERNHAEALERGIFAVLPGAASRNAYSLSAERRLVESQDVTEERIHAGFDANGRLVGFAIEASGMGYADTIRVLYGYAPDSGTIVGFRVLASKETPGLGDKIETDSGFLDNFDALDVSLDDTGQALEHPLATVKEGTKTEAWQLDGITGATISSKAIGEILNASAGRWVPVIEAELTNVSPAEANDAS